MAIVIDWKLIVCKSFLVNHRTVLHSLSQDDKYRIMTNMKVETDIITSCTCLSVWKCTNKFLTLSYFGISVWYLEYHSYFVYRIISSLKVNIIISITVGPIGQAVIMYVKTFKTAVAIFFIGNIIMCLRSHCPIMFRISVRSLILTISLGKIQINSKCFSYNITWQDPN